MYHYINGNEYTIDSIKSSANFCQQVPSEIGGGERGEEGWVPARAGGGRLATLGGGRAVEVLVKPLQQVHEELVRVMLTETSEHTFDALRYINTNRLFIAKK